MLINTYMNKTKHISVRVNEEVKRQLINEAKKQNVTISNLVLSSITNEKIKHLLSFVKHTFN